ncbi:MAG: hypothetical protein IJV74_01395, partial [Clostridia bacterium]|nr:hypothetical protein [Clostridia bacterium]
ISNINSFAATVAAYLGRLENVAKYMENCFNSVSDAMEHLETAVEAIEKTAGDFAEVLKDIGYAMDQLGKAQDMLSGAIGLCRSAINELSEYFEALGGRIEDNIGDNADKLPDSGSSGSGSAGDTPPAGGETLPEGGDTPPAGGDTPPAGGDTPPAGDDGPPAGGDTPPAGDDGPPAGGDTPPEGNDTPPADDDGPQLPDIGDIIPIPDQDEIDKIVGGIAGELEIFTEAMGAALGKLSSALGLLDSASGYLDDAIEKGIEPAVEKLTAMAENADAVTKPIEDALEDFDFAADALGDAAGETSSILGDLSHEDTEIIQGLGSGFMEETDRMEAALAGLSGQMEKLNTAMTGSANLMSEDLRNINDQFFKVMDCFMDLLEGNQNPGSVYKDVSEEQLFYTKEGKLEDCENRGNVDGDVNVGGIAGTVAIEYDLDPEEDISVSGGGSGTFRYFTNAVVLSCTNHNPVCSKKNASGGIVGYMDLGVVYSCENYGDVSSTSGDYAGGIAGQSAATVRNSMCLAAVSGRDYVGGIAGSVADISGCKAIVTVNSTGGWKGSIAGEVTGEAKENYFVGEKLGGIDGVSYAGKAEPMEYTEFTEAKGLSGEFEEFKLTFATDNMLVESLSFTYGGSIDPSEIPEVPKREGYVGEWEDYDFNNLTVSDTVYAVYTPYDTVVAAGESVGKRAVVLLEGAFLPGSTPGLEHCENAPEGSLEAWTVTAVGSVEESFTLRYLMPDEEAELYILRADGSWEKAAAESEGSYVLLDAEGESLSFAAVAAEKEFPVTALILTGAGGAVLVLLVLIMRARAGRGKHTAKK